MGETIDVSKDVCPILTKVRLPSNIKSADGSVSENYIWLPKAERNFPNCIHQDWNLDISWFEDQMKFLKGLTTEERTLLRSYTRTGDEVINMILRGKPDVNALMGIVTKLKTPTYSRERNKITESGDRVYFPKPEEVTVRENIFAPVPLDSINESNVVKVATEYVNRFRSVFSRAPVIKKPLRVFRGVDPEDEIKVFPLRGFSSTTYDPFSSSVGSFANIYLQCCVMDIVLLPGVRALWIEPISEFENEREIIVDSISVTTNISKTPTLSNIISINPYSGEATWGKKVTQINVFKCEVAPKGGILSRVASIFKPKLGGMYWPAKYHRGLTRRQNAQRKRSATRRTRMSWKDPKAYSPWKTDKGVKTRRSSYSSRFHSKYPEAKTLPEIAKATGVPVSTLRTVYNRGMAAWRTGHRPGASQHAWGMARVHSFVLHGKTWRTADADLAKTSRGKE